MLISIQPNPDTEGGETVSTFIIPVTPEPGSPSKMRLGSLVYVVDRDPRTVGEIVADLHNAGVDGLLVFEEGAYCDKSNWPQRRAEDHHSRHYTDVSGVWRCGDCRSRLCLVTVYRTPDEAATDEVEARSVPYCPRCEEKPV